WSTTVRACAASDDGPRPRTPARLADDLGALLGSLTGPFVLVGHSWGGPIVRLLASRNAAPVKGLVLVDPSDENETERTALIFGRPAQPATVQYPSSQDA
ncbi:alpha/beta fold hydrolase, partial [Dactylosporangium sp. NPDC005572]|uniref:alpha/beta fold hydrolase n=1 Tax=Dactylosporangium sp. NPDC005572 TaxID=3156889 RepID=UPI0033B3B347